MHVKEIKQWPSTNNAKHGQNSAYICLLWHASRRQVPWLPYTGNVVVIMHFFPQNTNMACPKVKKVMRSLQAHIQHTLVVKWNHLQETPRYKGILLVSFIFYNVEWCWFSLLQSTTQLLHTDDNVHKLDRLLQGFFSGTLL